MVQEMYSYSLQPAAEEDHTDWSRNLLLDLQSMFGDSTPPLLEGQTEEDLRINLTISGTEFVMLNWSRSRVSITIKRDISDLGTIDVGIDEEDAHVDLGLELQLEWFAPAYKWPPEAYGNITETHVHGLQTTYIKSNVAVEGRGLNR